MLGFLKSPMISCPPPRSWNCTSETIFDSSTTVPQFVQIESPRPESSSISEELQNGQVFVIYLTVKFDKVRLTSKNASDIPIVV
jgi:hypothetical protein